MDDHFFGAREFFDFFGRNGIEWWFIEPQPRLLDGSRGAPIGGVVGFGKPVHFLSVVDCFHEAERRLELIGKTLVDLSTHNSPDRRTGGRVVLIDDLDEDSMARVLLWWAGSAAVLETSEDNFQVLLVLAGGQDQAGLTTVSQSLAQRFDGDLAAARGGQPHRFPGSPNFKFGPGVEPFRCRLIALRPELDELRAIEQTRELRGSPALTRRTALSSAAQPLGGGGQDQTNSGKAMSWTLSQLKRGTPDRQILDGLAARFLGHHDPDVWPERTLHNAKFFLGWVPSRYRSS